MSNFMVIGVHELGWYDSPNEEENPITNTNIVARVRMFFGKIDPVLHPFGETSVDEDFPLPKPFDHSTDYALIEQNLEQVIERRMGEIQNGVDGDTTQRERVENDHRPT